MSENFSILSLDQLNDQQIDQICQIHQTAIPTLLAKLGKPFLYAYYQNAKKDPDVIAISAVDNNGRVLGWALGSYHPAKLIADLRGNKIWFAKNLTQALLKKPTLFFELLLSLREVPENQTSERQMELTYIATSPETRSKGIGSTLLARFLDRVQVFGASSIVLSVETDNPNAIQFYKKSGFSIISSFTEGIYHRHRMFLLIDPNKSLA